MLNQYVPRAASLREASKRGDEVERKRREASVAAQAARDAARLVKAINDRIGHWQAESVRLATAAERMKRSARYEPAVVEAIAILIATVERQEREFAAILVEVPPGIAQHSRVHDTKRALRMVLARLKAAARAPTETG